MWLGDCTHCTRDRVIGRSLNAEVAVYAVYFLFDLLIFLSNVTEAALILHLIRHLFIVAMNLCYTSVLFQLFFEGVSLPVADTLHFAQMLEIHLFPNFGGDWALRVQIECH